MDFETDAMDLYRVEVRKSSVLFVRLLQSTVDVNNIPIAYQAVKVASKDSSGRTRLWLGRLHPRSDSSSAEEQGTVKNVDTVRVA